jgi:hypothetical protein
VQARYGRRQSGNSHSNHITTRAQPSALTNAPDKGLRIPALITDDRTTDSTTGCSPTHMGYHRIQESGEKRYVSYSDDQTRAVLSMLAAAHIATQWKLLLQLALSCNARSLLLDIHNQTVTWVALAGCPTHCMMAPAAMLASANGPADPCHQIASSRSRKMMTS